VDSVLDGKWGRALNGFYVAGIVFISFHLLQSANVIDLDNPLTFRMMWALIVWGGAFGLFPEPMWALLAFARAILFGLFLTFFLVTALQTTVWWVLTGEMVDNIAWTYVAISICFPGIYIISLYKFRHKGEEFLDAVNKKEAVKVVKIATGNPVLSLLTALLSVISVLLLLLLRSGVPIETILKAPGG